MKTNHRLPPLRSLVVDLGNANVLYHSLTGLQEFNGLGPQEPLFFVLTCSFLLKHPLANVR